MPAPDFPALLSRLGLACGIAAPVLWALMIVLCGALTPDYSHLADFISELAAHEAPTELLMRYAGFMMTGAGYVAFAVVLGLRSRFDMLALVGAGFIALAGVARILAGVHACDPGCEPLRPSQDQVLHNVTARIAYFAMIVAAIYWGVVGNRYVVLRRLSALGIGCGVWAVVFLMLMIAAGTHEGLFQRLASAVLSVWMLVFAVTVYRAGLATEALVPAPDDAAASGRAA